MTSFKSGESIEYFQFHTNTWRPGKYIGSKDGIQHVIQNAYGNMLTVGPHRCRNKPVRQDLTGHLVIYTNAHGRKIAIGPLPDQHAINKSIEEWSRIYPDGPDAVIDITSLGITYDLGDGLKPQGEQQ